MTAETGQWSQDETPWLRTKLEDKTAKGACPFCGDETVVISDYDQGRDTGRIEIYCGSEQCQAREIVILRLRGEDASRRNDVRVLRALDESEKPGAEARTLAEIDADPSLTDKALLIRRQGDGGVRVFSRSGEPDAWYEDPQGV